MSQAPRAQSNSYVDGSAGWRLFFICVLIASVLGVGFRLYFSPERLKTWVTAALNEQKKKSTSPFAFAFDSAELRLAQGAMPEFAVVLKGVKVAPAPQCHPEPSLTIAELRLPFRFSSLFRGRFAVGVVSADTVAVDLDGLKIRCPGPSANNLETSGASGESSASTSTVPVAGAVEAPAKPWWTETRIREIGNLVEGIDFTHVEIFFENKEKHVFLESLSAEIHRGNPEAGMGGDAIDIATELRIPPEAAYGERLPSFVIEGSASAIRADVKVTARVDEGEIESAAILTPGPGKSLLIDAVLGVEDLPLSTIVPMMRKFGLAGARFHPKFLWVDCQAKIKGRFQKLFELSPLYLEDCRVEGEGTKVTLAKATRMPDGHWDPFTVKIETLDIAKTLSAIEAQGPEGISSQFGRLNGVLRVENPQKADFKGAIQGAKLIFSNERVSAEQDVDRADLQVVLDGGRFTGEIGKVNLRNGEAQGALTAEFSRDLKEGTVELKLAKVVFDPVVQGVLVKGALGPLSGGGVAKLADGRLVSMQATAEIGETLGRDLQFENASVKVGALPKSKATISIEMPTLQIHRSSKFFTSLKPVFLTHLFSDEWVRFGKARVDLEIAEDLPTRWSNASAKLENGQIDLRSEGSMSREGHLFGRINVDFPKAKDLGWTIAGDTALPILQDSTKALERLRQSVEITDESLGLVQRR